MRGAGLLPRVLPPLAPIILLAYFGVSTADFLTTSNLQDIAQSAGVLLTLAVGTTYVIMVGAIDLSQASLLGLAEVVTAKLAPDVGIWAFPLVMAGGLAAGVLTGLVHTQLRIPSFLATLAMGGIWLSLALELTNGTLMFLPPSSWGNVQWVKDTPAGIPVTLLVAIVFVAMGVVIERRTAFGRSLYAIGAGEPTARASGIAVDRYKILAFGLSSLTAATAGALYTGQFVSGNPEAGSTLLLIAIVVVVVGGTPLSGGAGGCLRTLAGVLTITILINGLTFAGVDPIAQEMVIGPILVLVAALTIDRSRLQLR